MADFMPVTASSGPKINDPEAVERIIGGFYFDPEFKIGTAFDPGDGSPYLFVYGHVWPEAWRLPAGATRDDYDPYASDTYEDGGEGFIELLRALAPNLDQPLTVQAVGSEKCRYPLAACQWHIEPGGTEVAVSEFGSPCTAAV